MLLFFKNHFVLFWSFTCETWQGYLEDSSAQGGGARPEGPDPCQPDPVSLLTVPSPGPLLVAREPRMDSCMQTDEEMQNYINCLLLPLFHVFPSLHNLLPAKWHHQIIALAQKAKEAVPQSSALRPAS